MNKNNCQNLVARNLWSATKSLRVAALCTLMALSTAIPRSTYAQIFTVKCPTPISISGEFDQLCTGTKYNYSFRWYGQSIKRPTFKITVNGGSIISGIETAPGQYREYYEPGTTVIEESLNALAFISEFSIEVQWAPWGGQQILVEGTDLGGVSSGMLGAVVCKTSSSQGITVSGTTSPGNITPVSTFLTDCNANTIYNYKVAAQGYKTYAWEAPAGWSIVSGQGTSTVGIKSNAANAGGTLKVAATGKCDGTTTKTATISIDQNALQMPAAPLLKSGEALACAGGENNFVISPDISSRSSFQNYRWSTASELGGSEAFLATFPQSNTLDNTFNTRQTEVKVRYGLPADQSNLYVCAEAFYGCGKSAKNCSPVVTPKNVLPITNISRISTVPYDNLGGVHNFKITSPYPAGETGVTYLYNIRGILTGGVQPVIVANNGTSFETAADNINVRVNNANGVQVTITTKNQCGLSTTSFVKDFPFNNSLEFDGVDDYAQVPHNSQLNLGSGSYTFEAWINTTPVTNEKNNTNATLLSKLENNPGQSSQGFIFGLNSAGRLFITNSAGVRTSTYPISLRDGQCHHVAVSFDLRARTTNFFVDGVLRDNQRSLGPDLNNTEVLRIGNWLYQPNAQIYPFQSVIDEVRMWKVARTAQDIQDYWRTSLAGNEAGLVAYWKMNDGTGQIVKDFGMNGLNATLGSNGASTDGNDPMWKTQYAICSNVARKGIAIEENEAMNIEAISLFPNPATNTVNIRSSNGAELESVRMTDIQGRQVADFGNIESIDVSSFASGLYYLELTVNGNIERKKLQIVK